MSMHVKECLFIFNKSFVTCERVICVSCSFCDINLREKIDLLCLLSLHLRTVPPVWLFLPVPAEAAVVLSSKARPIKVTSRECRHFRLLLLSHAFLTSCRLKKRFVYILCFNISPFNSARVLIVEE